MVRYVSRKGSQIFQWVSLQAVLGRSSRGFTGASGPRAPGREPISPGLSALAPGAAALCRAVGSPGEAPGARRRGEKVRPAPPASAWNKKKPGAALWLETNSQKSANQRSVRGLLLADDRGHARRRALRGTKKAWSRPKGRSAYHAGGLQRLWGVSDARREIDYQAAPRMARSPTSPAEILEPV
jgi:hypothetical protein